MPVSHPEKYRNAEQVLQGFGLHAGPMGERGTAADGGVAAGDLFEHVRGDRLASANVRKVLRYVLDAFRRSVGEQQDAAVHGRNSRTISTTALTLSTGVSGRIPWPRLKMCPGRVPVRFSSSCTLARNSGSGANSATGSRLP